MHLAQRRIRVNFGTQAPSGQCKFGIQATSKYRAFPAWIFTFAMKLDAKALRYMSADEFRVLTAVSYTGKDLCIRF